MPFPYRFRAGNKGAKMEEKKDLRGYSNEELVMLGQEAEKEMAERFSYYVKNGFLPQKEKFTHLKGESDAL